MFGLISPSCSKVGQAFLPDISYRRMTCVSVGPSGVRGCGIRPSLLESGSAVDAASQVSHAVGAAETEYGREFTQRTGGQLA